jgi:hypothetical protein
MSRFLSTARTDDLIEVTGVEYKKEDRTITHFGTAGALRKHMDKIVDAIPTKFTFDQESLDQVDALGATYDVQVRIDDYGRRMRKYDIDSTFQILCLKDTEVAPTDATTCKDLLVEYESLTEEEVRQSNKLYRQYGNDWDIQNASLSENLLENSCEEELRLKVKERLDTIPVVERGGPLYFYIMVHKILSMSDDTIRMLTDRITNMNIKEVQGEDILKIVTIYRHTLKRLANVKKVPHDMLTKLLEGLQTTSVDDFNATFKHIAITLKTDFDHHAHKLITIDSCLDLAETLYVDHKEHGHWVGLPKGKIAGGLVVGTEVCWNCGKVGHLARDCDQPQTGRASGPRGGAGRGAGPGGRGGGPRSAYSTPPAAGEPHIKTIDDHLCKYCARCRKWFWGPKAHLTEEHIVGAGRAQPGGAPQAQAMANIAPALTPPTPPEPPPVVTVAPGRVAPPLDPVVVDLMTDEGKERAERIHWSASVLRREAPAQH